jgi:hypothetical protein
LALERRAAQVKEKQEKTAEVSELRQQFFHQADDAPAKPDLDDRERDRGDRRGGRDVRDRGRGDRGSDRGERDRDHWRDRRNDDIEKNRVGGGDSRVDGRRERDGRGDGRGSGRGDTDNQGDRDRDRRREELEKKEHLTREETQEYSEIKVRVVPIACCNMFVSWRTHNV